MRIFLLALSLFLPIAASAAPAPYYQWQSKLDGRPFRDLNCSMPAARVERPTSVPGFRPQPGR